MQKQHQILKQKFKLSPQQIQFLGLLAIPLVDLEKRIEEELEEVMQLLNKQLAWTMFSPSFIDIGIFLGTIGFFFVLFLMYARTFPVVAQAELKTILKSSGSEYKKRSHE